MKSIIVADTSPLIALVKLKQLTLLNHEFTSVHVPTTALSETSRAKLPNPGRWRVGYFAQRQTIRGYSCGRTVHQRFAGAGISLVRSLGAKGVASSGRVIRSFRWKIVALFDVDSLKRYSLIQRDPGRRPIGPRLIAVNRIPSSIPGRASTAVHGSVAAAITASAG